MTKNETTPQPQEPAPGPTASGPTPPAPADPAPAEPAPAEPVPTATPTPESVPTAASSPEPVAASEPEPAPAAAPAESDAASAPKPAAAPAPEPAPTTGGKTYHWGTGRRKRAIARVRLYEGTGKFEINGRPMDEYFHLAKDRLVIKKPLETTGVGQRVDVRVNVYGGGTTGQADAILLGLSRALCKLDASYHDPLRDARFLTRDARKVERKKYGQRGARRRFQFSKR